MIKRIGAVFILCFIFEYAYTQNVHFQHITSADGLSQSEVYSFLEDSRGFMWFGTLHGLNRYDGYDIMVFNSDRDSINAITNNTIRSLNEDDWGRVWIGTDDGLNVYDPVSQKIFQVKLSNVNNQQLRIYSILPDEKDLLLGTSAGLLRGNIETENLHEIASNFHEIRYSDRERGSIYLLEKSQDGIIWVATENSFTGLVFKEGIEKPIITEHVTNRLVGVRDIALDASNNLWLTTFDQGFFRYNVKERSLDQFTQNSQNTSITSSKTIAVTSDAEGNLWIGTRDKGLLFLSKNYLEDPNPSFESIQSNPFDSRSLNSNLIYSLYFSRKNLLWVGTVGSGINMYDPNQKEFNHYRIPPGMGANESGSNFIRSVYADSHDNTWIGTHNNGLFVFDRASNQFHKAGFETHAVFHITGINDRQLLICSSNGVSIGTITKDYQLTTKETSIKGACFFASKFKDDILWIATLHGLYRCRFKNGGIEVDEIWNTETEPRLSINNCRVLYYSEVYNELYVGTEGGGLNVLKLDSNYHVKEISIYQKGESSNSLSSNFIRAIIQDSNQNIWLGTYEGLNKVLRSTTTDSLTFQAYTVKDGLPNNMVQLLAEGNDDNIWIGTNNGLCKFNPQNKSFVRFSVTDGIQNNEFSEHAVYKKPDGEIIVGGVNGFNTFYPRKIQISNNTPNTTLTHFYLFNKEVKVGSTNSKKPTLTKSITLTDSLFLQPNQNNLGFEFSALIYSNPEKVQYAYKLEGLDRDWNYTDATNRRANYTNLEYGKYTFKVKSTNNDGKWEDSYNSIYIHIKTPFFYTWVAYILYALFVILILLYLTNYSVIKYTTKKKILLENEHNQQLHELDQLRNRFFINISHDLRTPLTLIASPLSMVLKDKGLKDHIRERLELAYRNVKKLKYITEQLLDISKAEAGKLAFRPQNGDFIRFIRKELSHFTDAIRSKGLNLNIVTDQDSIECSFDPDMISKIFFNLLSNAIKYTKEGEINIRIDLMTNQVLNGQDNPKHHNYIKLEIQDSGKGISQEELDKVFDRFYQGNNKDVEGYGIGLSHCKDLVEAHEGYIEASSTPDSGTTFRIFIPHLKPTDELKAYASHPTPDPDAKSMYELDHNNGQSTDTSLQKILIIEDNVDMRTFIKVELRKEYQIFEAEDGVEGLALVEKYSPDLIVSDIMMPHMDGIEFCRRIKSDIKTSHIPVILLTAKGDTDTKYKSIETGADDYIPKPFEIEYLSIRIKNLLIAKEQVRKAFQATNSLEPSTVAVTSLDKKFLSELISTIEEGIPDPDFTVNTLEFKMGMSHTNFYRKIKNLTGRSGKEILMDMRMKRAKQILTDSDGIRISEVAYHVGFSNPKYFSKCFKEYYGLLPSEITG